MSLGRDGGFGFGGYPRAGDRAPTFALPERFGSAATSSDLLARGPLVVLFMRPSPRISDVEALWRPVEGLWASGASVVLVMSGEVPDLPEAPYPVVADRTGVIADAFGLRSVLSVGPDPRSSRNRIPARLVIAPDGMVVYSDIDPACRSGFDPIELLPIVKLVAARWADVDV